MVLYWVNWLYADCYGKTCQGFFGEGEISLKRAMEGVECVRANEKNLIAAWVNRSEKQPDGNHKNVGTPYLEAFVDASGNRTARTLKVTDERGEPKKPIFRNNDAYQCELNHCPTCGHIVEGVESGERFAYCPQCGQRIDWDAAERDALGGEGGAAP